MHIVLYISYSGFGKKKGCQWEKQYLALSAPGQQMALHTGIITAATVGHWFAQVHFIHAKFSSWLQLWRVSAECCSPRVLAAFDRLYPKGEFCNVLPLVSIPCLLFRISVASESLHNGPLTSFCPNHHHHHHHQGSPSGAHHKGGEH